MIKLIVIRYRWNTCKRWDSGYQSGIYGCDKEAHGKGDTLCGMFRQTVLQ